MTNLCFIILGRVIVEPCILWEERPGFWRSNTRSLGRIPEGTELTLKGLKQPIPLPEDNHPRIQHLLAKKNFQQEGKFGLHFLPLTLEGSKCQSARRKNVDTKKYEKCAYCLQMGGIGDIHIQILFAWECPGVSVTSFVPKSDFQSGNSAAVVAIA
ncbi:hypothetical protein NPIL_88911 [Nephila pilipes]|uniref:Uncharacterized protein n=1 Tax=Nephila pilipes TaxID=299642 RepID=A0A8X6M7U1_NEPPI|nr:hypothetical protein NPIL_88911 [Nephila pilipes]